MYYSLFAVTSLFGKDNVKAYSNIYYFWGYIVLTTSQLLGILAIAFLFEESLMKFNINDTIFVLTFMVLFPVINYYLLLQRKKYQRIIERYFKRSKRSRLFLGVLAIGYYLFIIVLFIYSIQP